MKLPQSTVTQVCSLLVCVLFGQPASLILVCTVRPRSPGSVRGQRDEGEELKCLLGKVWLKPDLHLLTNFQSGNKIFSVVLKSMSALAFPVVRREMAVQPDLSTSFPHLCIPTTLITFDIPVSLQSCRIGNRMSPFQTTNTLSAPNRK